MIPNDSKVWLPLHFVRVAVTTFCEACFHQSRAVKPLTLKLVL